MKNPFQLRWLEGWTFLIVLTEGQVKIEAHGFGTCLRTSLNPGESPESVADLLVYKEDNRRRSLHNAWLKGQTLPESHPERIAIKEKHEKEQISAEKVLN